jgi:hypothetical protein
LEIGAVQTREVTGFSSALVFGLSESARPPHQYGKFNAIHRQYKRWCDNDRCPIARFARARRELLAEQDMENSKGGSTRRLMRRVCRYGLLKDLIDGFDCEFLLADRGYDSNEIMDFAGENGAIAIISSRKITNNSIFTAKSFINLDVLFKTRFKA